MAMGKKLALTGSAIFPLIQANSRRTFLLLVEGGMVKKGGNSWVVFPIDTENLPCGNLFLLLGASCGLHFALSLTRCACFREHTTWAPSAKGRRSV